MQNLPTNWAELFEAPHRTEYKLVINGIEYDSTHLQGNPVLTKPLLEKPTIGRVCSATLSATVIPYEDTPIPSVFVFKTFRRGRKCNRLDSARPFLCEFP